MKFRIVTTLLLLAVLAALELWSAPSGDANANANATSAPSTPSQTSTPSSGSSLGGVRIF